jgi:high-affinity iron transporter
MSHSIASPARSRSSLVSTGLILGALVIAVVLIWQGITAAGNPDPMVPGTTTPVAILDIAVLVFREGLECVLVLGAITAGLMGSNQPYRRPIAVGAAIGFLATLITWFIAVHIENDLLGNISALSLQAWTGLLAIIVLLIVLNWFFHKVYWTGWISFQNRTKTRLLQTAQTPGSSRNRLLLGLGLLGFASFYREGFEVVLFLQSYRLRMGNETVLTGAALGMFFAAIVAVLTFVGNHRLPYKRMLILTGILLVFVLIMMVGEEVNEMQLAGWIGTSPIGWLQWVPDWAGTWLSIFPNVQGVIAVVVAVATVLGCYFLSRYQAIVLPRKRGLAPFALRDAPETAPSVRASVSPH